MTTIQKVLLTNAVSSGATGVLLAAFSPVIADLLGTPHAWVVQETGVFLILFAVFVGGVGLQNPPKRGLIRLIISLDMLWVVGSLVIIFIQLFGLSTTGYIIIAVVAAWVGLMALLQNKFLPQTV
jgi:hypothetical protein